MKISGSTPNYINQSYASQSNSVTKINLEQKKGHSPDPIKQDSLSFSEKTRDLARINQNMDQSPTDREKRIADLKEQIQNKQYDVQPDQLAEKMLNSVMDDLG